MSDLAASRNRVLLLGAGFVVKPTLDILADAGIDVTVGMRLALQCDVN
jgi:saccharopine dehydrogenase-like NADP-dependent oxidoreductase